MGQLGTYLYKVRCKWGTRHETMRRRSTCVVTDVTK